MHLSWPSRSLPCMISLSLLCNLVTSRHIHGRAMHKHHVRPIAAPMLDRLATSTTSAGIPAITEGNAVIQDIQDIQNGLTNLPSDVLNFVTAVEQRLQALESILSSLLSGTAAPAMPTTTSQASASTTSNSTFSTSSTLCLPPDGAGPLVTCPAYQVTQTSTSTSLNTVTTQVVYGGWNYSGAAYGGSGTAQVPANTGGYLTTVTPTTSMNSTATSPPLSTSTAYTFQADSDHNVAVYYGTTPDTQAGGLLALCQNANVDIAILISVYDFFTQDGYPTMDFGPACSGPNTAQAASAPGLQDCSGLAPEISGCQSLGKKVLVSLGGYIANSSFSSDAQAEQFATTLWNLFGAGTGDDSQLRPFGSVVIDGFDIDNENHVTTYYETFAAALRQQYALDTSKTYYLSAAPQCPLPDESIPLGAMTQADFVWVQFYNNPSCNLDTDGFQASFAAWSAYLSGSSTTPGKPRLYIGAGAFAGAGSGYVRGAGLSVPISMAREFNVDNLGGIMLWDGSEAMANVDQYGDDYLEYAKAALQG